VRSRSIDSVNSQRRREMKIPEHASGSTPMGVEVHTMIPRLEK
jgi:hypothetical protein